MNARKKGRNFSPPSHSSVIVSQRRRRKEDTTTQHCADTHGHLVIFLFVRRRKLFEKSIKAVAL